MLLQKKEENIHLKTSVKFDAKKDDVNESYIKSIFWACIYHVYKIIDFSDGRKYSNTDAAQMWRETDKSLKDQQTETEGKMKGSTFLSQKESKVGGLVSF